MNPAAVPKALLEDGLMCWIPDAEDGFVLGQIKSQSNDELTVELSTTGLHITVKRQDVQEANPAKFDKVEDMSELTHLNEASVLNNLKQRYNSDLIYTYSGLFCVVINPYKKLPIYTEKVVEQFKGKQRHEMPPHIFAIADAAYRSLLTEHKNQAILCTGESGAGKTENTKKVIQYLVSTASQNHDNDAQGNLEQQLLHANPILEAFGNAKTAKNDNSSRFGKLIRIKFEPNGSIIGADTDFYLLETFRVIRQEKNERNLHFFYQLLAGSSDTQKKMYFLEDANDYKFLGSGIATITNVNDVEDFQKTMKSMEIMGFSDNEISFILRHVSAILLLGNVKFSQDKASDQSILPDDSVLAKVCELLGLPLAGLKKGFLNPRIKVGTEFVDKAQTQEHAEFAVEAIAKATYERLFKWIVATINSSLNQPTHQGASFIGILDIAGFEIFERNSFEQICINYTNEKLQQFFNDTMLVREQEEYLREGIAWKPVDFGLDRQATIDLIEKKSGVLDLLNEECLFPKGTDKTFVEKLKTKLCKNPMFKIPDWRSKNDFIVSHYAGDVEYSADQWLKKNRDPVNDSVVDLLKKSTDPLVRDLWEDAAPTTNALFRSVSQIHKKQLKELMDILQKTTPHFVRCIIPNHHKQMGKLDWKLVLEQLRNNGVLEGIRISRMGFPNKLCVEQFASSYKMLAPDVNNVEDLLSALDIGKDEYHIGESRLFFKTGVLAKLEEKKKNVMKKDQSANNCSKLSELEELYMRQRRQILELESELAAVKNGEEDMARMNKLMQEKLQERKIDRSLLINELKGQIEFNEAENREMSRQLENELEQSRQELDELRTVRRTEDSEVSELRRLLDAERAKTIRAAKEGDDALMMHDQLLSEIDRLRKVCEDWRLKNNCIRAGLSSSSIERILSSKNDSTDSLRKAAEQ